MSPVRVASPYTRPIDCVLKHFQLQLPSEYLSLHLILPFAFPAIPLPLLSSNEYLQNNPNRNQQKILKCFNGRQPPDNSSHRQEKVEEGESETLSTNM